MNRNNAIGAYTYDAELQAFKTPGSPGYIPPPTDQMLCGEISATLDVLNQTIATYKNLLAQAGSTFIPSQAKISNLGQILVILGGLKSKYTAKLSTCSNETVQQQPTNQNPIPTPSTTGGTKQGGAGLLILGGLFAGFLYLKKKKKKN